MERWAARVGITALSKLGRCALCMRAAFLSAVAGIAAAIAASLLLPSSLALLSMALAIGFVVLWLAHLAAYATRATRHSPPSEAAPQHSRRQALAVFARAFMFVAVASAAPLLLRGAALAQSGCPATAPYLCGSDWCCSGPAYYFCQGYTGYDPNWRARGTFCTNENSDEAVADLRSNCAIFEFC